MKKFLIALSLFAAFSNNLYAAKEGDKISVDGKNYIIRKHGVHDGNCFFASMIYSVLINKGTDGLLSVIEVLKRRIADCRARQEPIKLTEEEARMSRKYGTTFDGEYQRKNDDPAIKYDLSVEKILQLSVDDLKNNTNAAKEFVKSFRHLVEKFVKCNYFDKAGNIQEGKGKIIGGINQIAYANGLGNISNWNEMKKTILGYGDNKFADASLALILNATGVFSINVIDENVHQGNYSYVNAMIDSVATNLKVEASLSENKAFQIDILHHDVEYYDALVAEKQSFNGSSN